MNITGTMIWDMDKSTKLHEVFVLYNGRYLAQPYKIGNQLFVNFGFDCAEDLNNFNKFENRLNITITETTRKTFLKRCLLKLKSIIS